ncbi:MAG: squalene synthase HpnC [Elusimicrobia bacterium]|nr:squalene synthase HpnC [Elusimicrobiota bacterium]
MDTLRAFEARMTDPGDLDSAYAFCARLTGGRYADFPAAPWMLAAPLRRHVAAVAAFARIADDLADEPEFEGVRRELLDGWRSRLHDLGKRPSDHPVFVALDRTVMEMGLPVEPFDDLLSACIQDAEKGRYATYDEVLDYCRRAANPVGRLVLMIHGHTAMELLRYSDAICTALQLTNFWQNMAADLKKDRLYIPAEDFKACGYAEADLRMGVVNEKFRQLMKAQWRRTKALFDQGRVLTSKLPRPLAWQVALAWHAGVDILRKISQADFDTLTGRPRLTGWDGVRLLGRALLRP